MSNKKLGGEKLITGKKTIQEEKSGNEELIFSNKEKWNKNKINKFLIIEIAAKSENIK